MTYKNTDIVIESAITVLVCVCVLLVVFKNINMSDAEQTAVYARRQIAEQQRLEPYAIEGRLPERGDVLYVKLTGEPVTALEFSDLYLTYPVKPLAAIRCRVYTGRSYRDGVFSKDSYSSEYVLVTFAVIELTWKDPQE